MFLFFVIKFLEQPFLSKWRLLSSSRIFPKSLKYEVLFQNFQGHLTVLTLYRKNPVHELLSLFLRSNFRVLSHLRLGLVSGLLPLAIPTRALYIPLLLLSTIHVVRRELVPLHKKVPHALYSNLSSLDNLMMAYTQGRNL